MGLTKNRENFKLLVKFPPREKSPSNFYKIEGGGGVVPGPYTHAKFHHSHS